MFRAASRVGLELSRLGDEFGQKPAKPKPKPLDPVFAALRDAPQIRSLVGALAFNVRPDEETMCWAELAPGSLGPSLGLFTWLGRERAAELGEAAATALRSAGWRILGAGPTVLPARKKASGIWAAHLALSAQKAPVSAPRPTRASMAR